MVRDIFNYLSGLVFQKIKHSVSPIFVMFYFHVFVTIGREVLKTKINLYQGHIQKQKPLSFFTH
jgi:hypothetical protein